MEVNRKRIVDDLRTSLDIQSGDCIVVHSSLKSMGHVIGGAGTVIESLLEAVGGADIGTLMTPCFNAPAPQIDLRSTQCRLGAVPEAFRTYPGVTRSENWSHSVAVTGHLAARIAATHRGRDPLSKDSPYHELAKVGGYVVHIGCDMSTSSIIHVAESIAGIPYQHIGYPGYEQPMRLIVDEETSYVCKTEEKPGCSRKFTVVQEELDRLGLIHHGAVGAADAIKIKGLDILKIAGELLEEDPCALLCNRESCDVCRRRREYIVSLNKH